jgi:CheY-like chemotaxis protein
MRYFQAERSLKIGDRMPNVLIIRSGRAHPPARQAGAGTCRIRGRGSQHHHGSHRATLQSLPDVIILDCPLGDCGLGLDLLREIRTTPHTRNIPVVITTCLPEPDLDARLRSCGAPAYLLKPLARATWCRRRGGQRDQGASPPSTPPPRERRSRLRPCKGHRTNSGSPIAHGVTHQRDQFRRRARFLAEDDAQSFVLGFRFRQTRDDDHRNVGLHMAKLADELGTAGPRQDVIGDDRADAGTQLLGAEQGMRALRRGRD